jgi:hypothetical protein
MKRLRDELRQLDAASRVFNDVFAFAFPSDAPIASINGLRLGLLSFGDPDWAGEYPF